MKILSLFFKSCSEEIETLVILKEFWNYDILINCKQTTGTAPVIIFWYLFQNIING